MQSFEAYCHPAHRYMYCAIDEAGSHVGSKRFRLVVGVYNQTGEELLGSGCSQPIRVLANNDIPKGAAHIPLVVTVRYCPLVTCVESDNSCIIRSIGFAGLYVVILCNLQLAL